MSAPNLNTMPAEMLQQIVLHSGNPRAILVDRKMRGALSDVIFQKKFIQRLICGSDLPILRSYAKEVWESKDLGLIQKIQLIFNFQVSLIQNLDPNILLQFPNESAWNPEFYKTWSKWVHKQHVIIFWDKLWPRHQHGPSWATLPQDAKVRTIFDQMRALTRPIREAKVTSSRLLEVPRSATKLPVHIVDFEDNEITIVPRALLANPHIVSLSFYRNKLEGIAMAETALAAENVPPAEALSQNKPEFQESHLEALDLRINRLTSMPKEVFSLHHLRVLKLSNNLIKAIPDEIEKLKELEELEVSDAGLVKISDKLALLPKLKKLIISNNPLTKLPKLPKSLEVLEFNNCKIKILPDFTTLPNLKSISGKNNEITSLPPAIKEAKKLVKVNFVENKIAALPEEIGELKLLEELFLSKNKIPALPQSIVMLLQLKYFTVSDNPLQSVPLELFAPGRLKMFYVPKHLEPKTTSKKDNSSTAKGILSGLRSAGGISGVAGSFLTV